MKRELSLDHIIRCVILETYVNQAVGLEKSARPRHHFEADLKQQLILSFTDINRPGSRFRNTSQPMFLDLAQQNSLKLSQEPNPTYHQQRILMKKEEMTRRSRRPVQMCFKQSGFYAPFGYNSTNSTSLAPNKDETSKMGDFLRTGEWLPYSIVHPLVPVTLQRHTGQKFTLILSYLTDFILFTSSHPYSSQSLSKDGLRQSGNDQFAVISVKNVTVS